MLAQEAAGTCGCVSHVVIPHVTAKSSSGRRQVTSLHLAGTGQAVVEGGRHGSGELPQPSAAQDVNVRTETAVLPVHFFSAHFLALLYVCDHGGQTTPRCPTVQAQSC